MNEDNITQRASNLRNKLFEGNITLEEFEELQRLSEIILVDEVELVDID